MSSEKKRGILERRETALQHAIRRNEPCKKLERFAEEVRAAQMALLKSELFRKRPLDSKSQSNSRSIMNAERKMHAWAMKSVHDIVRYYSKLTGSADS